MSSAPAPTPWGLVCLLAAMTAFAPMSIDMYLPAQIAIGADLKASHSQVELTLATFLAGMAIGQFFYGSASDRFGRRGPILVGCAVYIVASALCALTTSIEALIAARFLQALGGCAGGVIARAIVRDNFDHRDTARILSLLMLVMGLAPILAPIIGGWVVTLVGWRAIFILLFVFALACLLAIRLGLQESHSTRHEPPLNAQRIAGDYASLFNSRAFLGYTLSGGLAMAGMFAYIAGSPFVLIQLGGIAPQHFGWAFGINALGFIAASQINARSLKNIAPTRMLRRALWMPAVAGLALAGLTMTDTASLPLTLLCMFLYVSSLGFIAPNSSASALATFGQRAGTASALMGALQFGLATLTGIGISQLHDGTARPLALLLAACGVGAWLLHRWLVHPHDRHLR